MIQAFETQDCNTLEITMESNWLRPMQELAQAITAFTDQDG